MVGFMFLFFDTETTGKPRSYNAPVSDLRNWPRVVQLGWLQCDSRGREIDNKEYIIFPEGFRIPPDASRVHGITTERAISKGVPLKDVLEEFADALRPSRTLVAHNMSFDQNVLGAEFLRNGMDNPLEKKRRVCTMRTSTDHCKLPGPYGYKWPTLSELYRTLFKRAMRESHAALADVRTCARCFFELKRLGIIA